MTTDARRVAIDPSVEGPAPLPEVPQAGLVLVSVAANRADASAEHIVDFARRWRDEGRKVYLCDACFEAPVLHAAAGVENGEGLSDSLLYGTSFGRISHRIEQGLAVAPAGTVIGDPDAARSHSRWATILSGFHEAGALLVVTVPTGHEGAVLSDAASVHIGFETAVAEDILSSEVRLTEVSESSEGMDQTRSDDMSEAGLPATAPAAVHAPEAGDTASRDEAELPGRDRVASPPLGAFESTKRAGGRRAEKRGTSPLLILLLIAVAVVLGLGFFGIVEIPGETPTDVEAASDLLPNG